MMRFADAVVFCLAAWECPTSTKLAVKLDLDVRWRVTMAWLNNRRKQMRLFKVEFINSNFPGLINRVRRKIVPVS